MKPAAFEYQAPRTIDLALALLAEHGDDAKLLAGGQSLIPTMNFRLAQPTMLIDLGRVEGLAGIRRAGDGGVVIGAMTRQRDVEQSKLIAERAPLLAETMPWIAHPQIRNQGTFGGSIAHADPSAELPAVAVALGATMTVQSTRGTRRIAATDFFTDLFATALEPDELLVDIALPPLPERSGWAFEEVARRRGDYALFGVAVMLTFDRAGKIESAEIVDLSVGEGPVEALGAARMLLGETPSDELLRAASERAAMEDIDPPADIHASKPYRRQLARAMTRRALARACGLPNLTSRKA